MKYDIRANNIFYREIEGKDIESALNNAGLDVDFTKRGNGGYLHFDIVDLVGILQSDTDRNNDEILEALKADEFVVTFGIAE